MKLPPLTFHLVKLSTSGNVPPVSILTEQFQKVTSVEGKVTELKKSLRTAKMDPAMQTIV